MRTVSVSLTPPFARFGTVPPAQGLYDPSAEKDACGLAMVATLRGTAGHDIITGTSPIPSSASGSSSAWKEIGRAHV